MVVSVHFHMQWLLISSLVMCTCLFCVLDYRLAAFVSDCHVDCGACFWFCLFQIQHQLDSWFGGSTLIFFSSSLFMSLVLIYLLIYALMIVRSWGDSCPVLSYISRTRTRSLWGKKQLKPETSAIGNLASISQICVFVVVICLLLAGPAFHYWRLAAQRHH